MPRVDTETLARRDEVARRYLQGQTQAEIAAAFGLSQQQISLDLKAVRAAWLASAIRDFDQARAIELARIDEVERAAWDGWRRSMQDKEVSTQEGVGARDPQGRPIITKVTARKEGQAGSPAFLNTVLTCIERRCSILGLDAPKRFVIDWDNLEEEQIVRLAKGEPPEKVLTPRALTA